MTGVFVSYRHKDGKGYAFLLRDHLLKSYDQGEVFLDIEAMRPGEDFWAKIEKAIVQSNALIAVIGPSWLEIRDENGRRRLDNTEDMVRLEIATALQRGIQVIPVLVDRATMPCADELPSELVPLARLHAHEVSDRHLADDIASLVKAIGGGYGTVVVHLVGYISEDFKKRYWALFYLERKHGSKSRWVTINILRDSKVEFTKAMRHGATESFRVPTGTYAIEARYSMFGSPSDHRSSSDALVFRLRGGERVAFTARHSLTYEPVVPVLKKKLLRNEMRLVRYEYADQGHCIIERGDTFERLRHAIHRLDS